MKLFGNYLCIGVLGFLVVAIPQRALTGPEAIVAVGPFSSASAGGEFPDGWKPLIFPKILRHTLYELVQDEGITVVRATSDAAASGLVREVNIDLAAYPILRWRWKVSDVIAGGDVRTKAGDDYAARVYITFEYDPETTSFSRKVKYKLGRLLFGDVPIAAINYIWGTRTPPGTIVDSVYTDLSKMIIVESGGDLVGRWVEERRNVYEDYTAAFGEEPPLVNGVAIMSDSDNTGGKAVAYYGDIIFTRD
jgi:hypothetical protein